MERSRSHPATPNHQVDAVFEVGADVKLAGLHPHMHGRGKDFEYRVVYPTGETARCSACPAITGTGSSGTRWTSRYSFPRARRIECTAHFDNSPTIRTTPDPTKEVVWGDQSWDEMMVGFFNLVFDVGLPVREILPKKVTAGLN